MNLTLMDSMRIVSVNVGRPRLVIWKGTRVSTGIFKDPVEGPVEVKKLNLAGDRQADLSVHGGPDKAVYSYPAEHYPYWRKELPQADLPWGSFGENLTTEGLSKTPSASGTAYASALRSSSSPSRASPATKSPSASTATT